MKLQFDIDFYDQMWTSNASSATRLSFQNKGMSAENDADLLWNSRSCQPPLIAPPRRYPDGGHFIEVQL